MEKYVAYVASYTSGRSDNNGIRIFDVDVERGTFTPKDAVNISNSSYITVSHSGKYLYAITDVGIESFKIKDDGLLEKMNFNFINGMRGCYLSTDFEDKYIFCSGYHDGKLTVLQLTDNGAVGSITEEIYHKGMGRAAERNSQPHISCARMTKDNKYLLEADLGTDHVNVYRFDHATGKLELIDIIRSDMESAPRHIKFSKDGKIVYIVHELKNSVDVYRYTDENNDPEFERIQSISTVKNQYSRFSSASALTFSIDYKYLVTSNAGEDTVTLYAVEEGTGLLTDRFSLPISGDYPKDAALFPDNKHLVSLNNESNSLTFFAVDLEKNVMTMSAKELKVDAPNCLVFYRLPEDGKYFGKT